MSLLQRLLREREEARKTRQVGRRAADSTASVPRHTKQGERVGSELKELLRNFHVVAVEECKCESIAAEMDRRGAGWCESHVDTLAARMVAEAHRREWPLLNMGQALGIGAITDSIAHQTAKWLIQEAIRLARGKGNDPVQASTPVPLNLESAANGIDRPTA